MKQTTITILGGGIAGLTTAIALQKINLNPTVFEASPELKPVGAGLGLGINAMMALDALGIRDQITARGRMLPAFSLYDQAGRKILRTDSAALSRKYGENNFTIHRAALHECLLEQVGAENVHLSKRAVDLEIGKHSVTLRFADGSSHSTEYLIVADGIHSPIRQKLLPTAVPRYSGYTCWRSVMDLSAMQWDEASETWGPNGRFGIVPLADNKTYWFACINSPQNSEKARRFGTQDLLERFGHYHEPIPEILRHTDDEKLIWNDIVDLKPIKRFAFGRVLLTGDAAHATTPNMGQGACQAIEDAATLGQCIAKGSDMFEAFLEFEKRRLKRTRWITNTSWRLGKMAQLENPLLASLRNQALRLTPASAAERQLKKLAEVNFEVS